MESRFVGREQELERLESIYSQPGLNTCAVMGRRQVGKSTLLMKFAEGKRNLYLQFSRKSYYENLVYAKRVISEFLGREVDDFESFTEVMTVVRDICRESKTVVVFDELPYLIGCAQHAPSIIQRFIDIDARDLDCMVVICGSSISMMRDAIEKVGSPLYGRFPERMIVEPLSYRQCMEFHPHMSDLDAVRTYLTVGGIPIYHMMMGDGTYDGGIRRCFLGSMPYMNREGNAIVGEDSNAIVYSAILTCIAEGRVQQYRICQKTGLDKGNCSKVMKEMELIGLIARKHPMIGAPRKPEYYIKDNLLAFWYHVICRHQGKLANMSVSDDNKMRLMRNDIDTFLGKRFELLCMEYLCESYEVAEIGTWWGPVDGTDTDIDVVATVIADDMSVSQLLGECKFSRKLFGFPELNELVEAAESTRAMPNLRYILFSASGFDERLKEYAEDRPVLLVDLDKILGRTPADDLGRFPMGGFELL